MGELVFWVPYFTHFNNFHSLIMLQNEDLADL